MVWVWVGSIQFNLGRSPNKNPLAYCRCPRFSKDQQTINSPTKGIPQKFSNFNGTTNISHTLDYLWPHPRPTVALLGLGNGPGSRWWLWKCYIFYFFFTHAFCLLIDGGGGWTKTEQFQSKHTQKFPKINQTKLDLAKRCETLVTKKRFVKGSQLQPLAGGCSISQYPGGDSGGSPRFWSP